MAKYMVIKTLIFKCKIYLNPSIDINKILLKININKFKVSQVLIYLKLKVR